MDAAAVFASAAQGGALLDAEAMLFVDDDQGKVGETHRFLEQGVRADDDQRLGGIHGRLNLAAGRRGGRTRQQTHVGSLIPQWGEKGAQGGRMLLGEHLGRGDECTLMAGCDDLQERHERDDCLTRADISLEEALHRDLTLEVGADLRDGVHLGVGELEGQGIAETVQERGAVRGGDRRGRARSASAHR